MQVCNVDEEEAKTALLGAGNDVNTAAEHLFMRASGEAAAPAPAAPIAPAAPPAAPAAAAAAAAPVSKKRKAPAGSEQPAAARGKGKGKARAEPAPAPAPSAPAQRGKGKEKAAPAPRAAPAPSAAPAPGAPGSSAMHVDMPAPSTAPSSDRQRSPPTPNARKQSRDDDGPEESEYEAKRRRKIKENEEFFKMLGLEPIVEKQPQRRTAPRKDKAKASEDQPQRTSARTEVVAREPPKLRFQLQCTRALVWVIDTHVRELLEELDPDDCAAGMRLLDEPVAAGTEYLVGLLYHGVELAGAVFFRRGEARSWCDVALLAVSPDYEEVCAEISQALLVFVALLTARGGVDAAVDIGVRRSAPPSVDGALRSFGDAEPQPAVRYVGDGVGGGLTLKSNVGGPVQESHLKAAVAAAELALLGGVAPPPAASRAQRSNRRRTEDPLERALPREGEPVLVWEDKASCESVEQSGFFLATCLDVDVQLGEVGGRAASKSRHLDSEQVHRVKVSWEEGHDTGSSTVYLSTELCLVTPRDAADLEMGLSCGYASFEDGRPYERVAHQWARLAVEVGGVGWDELLAEHDRPPPELLLSWVASAFEATPKILFARAVKAWRRRPALAMDLPAVPRTSVDCDDAPLSFLEFFCGQAPLARAAQPRHASRRRRQRPSEGVAEHVQGEERLRRRRVPVPEDARGWSVPLRRAAQRRVLRGRLSPVATRPRDAAEVAERVGLGHARALGALRGRLRDLLQHGRRQTQRVELLHGRRSGVLPRQPLRAAHGRDDVPAALDLSAHRVHDRKPRGQAVPPPAHAPRRRARCRRRWPRARADLGDLVLLQRPMAAEEDDVLGERVCHRAAGVRLREGGPFEVSVVWKCGGPSHNCGLVDMHNKAGRTVRATETGGTGKEDTATYPDEFCEVIAGPTGMWNQLRARLQLDEGRGRRIDHGGLGRGVQGVNAGSNVDYRDDSHHAHCCVRDWRPDVHRLPLVARVNGEWKTCSLVGQQQNDELLKCHGCPRTFHRQCLPTEAHLPAGGERRRRTGYSV